MASLTWAVDSLDEIGGHACQVFGSPKVIDTDDGGHVSDESAGRGAPCAWPPPWSAHDEASGQSGRHCLLRMLKAALPLTAPCCCC